MGLELDDETAGVYSTIGGLLVAQAGQIPKAGDKVLLAGFEFTVLEVEGNRRVVELSARLVSTGDSTSGADGASDNKQKPAEESKAGGFLGSVLGNTAATDSPKTPTTSDSELTSATGSQSVTPKDTKSFRDGEWVSSSDVDGPAPASSESFSSAAGTESGSPKDTKSFREGNWV